VPGNLPVDELWFQGVTVTGVTDVVRRVVGDADLDGLAGGDDCDDTRATCTDDCTDADTDGLPDCDDPCFDVDGDGYGVGACLAEDCDDADAATFPGATEVPDDGIDQDCDGADVCSPGNDGDADGVCDDADLCDGDDATGDADGDGVCADLDACPADPGRATPGTCADVAACSSVSFLGTQPSSPDIGDALRVGFGSAALVDDLALADVFLSDARDLGATVSYVWTRDGVVQPEQTRPFLPWTATGAGESWSGQAVATFLDGSTCASSPTPVTVADASGPFQIFEAEPYRTDDADGCPVFECLYRAHDYVTDAEVTVTWLQGGTPVGTGETFSPGLAGVNSGFVTCEVEATLGGVTRTRTGTMQLRPFADAAFDLDGDRFCDAQDVCPGDDRDDSDADGVCDDVQVCALLADLAVAPSPADETADLTVLAGLDPAIRDRLDIRWTRNGVDDATGYLVPAASTSRGEVWQATVVSTYPDGCTGSASTTIGNAPPTLTGVTLTPANPDADDDLRCIPDGWADADGDAEGYRYAWAVDGIPQVETGDTLAAGSATRGQQVDCTVTPFDGFDEGLPQGASVVLDNARPRFVSEPTILPDPWEACTTVFTCDWQAEDSDGDPVVAVSYYWDYTVDGVNTVVPDPQATFEQTLPEGARLFCQVTITDGLDTASDTVAGYLVGEQPDVDVDGVCDADDDCVALASFAAVADLPDARQGEVLACVPEGVAPDCGTPPQGRTTAWFVDGVAVSAASSLDTTPYPGGSDVRCEVTSILADGTPGDTLVSNTVTLTDGTWTLLGVAPDALAGMAVSVLGDLDGDGMAELAIGAPNATSRGLESAGAVCVVEGGTNSGTTSLADIEAGIGGFALYGESGGWDPDTTICGGADNFVAISCTPNRAGTFVHTGNMGPIGDGFGARIARRSEVDGDGIPDLVVSAPSALAQGQYHNGRTYVIPGATLQGATTGGVERLDAVTIDGEQGTWPNRYYSNNGADRQWDGHLTGWGLATADMDGDGLDDIAVGAPEADAAGDGSGKAFFVFGAGLAESIALATDDWEGFTRWGVTNSFSDRQQGGHLGSVGDFDGDGFEDVYLGYESLDTETALVLGGDGAREDRTLYGPGTDQLSFYSDFEFACCSTNWWSNIFAGRAGTSGRGAGVGDFNADGKDDLLLPFIKGNVGPNDLELALFLGRETGPVQMDLDAPGNGIDGMVAIGRPAGVGGALQAWAGAPGDLDGDGYDEAAVLVVLTDRNLFRAYVIWGTDTPQNLSLADLEAGIGGFTLEHPGEWGREITGGDLDGDGFSDLVWGTAGADDAGADAGRVDVWFGRDVRGRLTHTGSADADTLTGTVAADRMVSGRGDDTLRGNGGADAFSAGAGDDRVEIADDSFVRIRGGEGVDTLAWLGGATLDLGTAARRIDGIEVLDLTSGSRHASLTAPAVLGLSQTTNTLRVDGDAADSLDFLGGGWVLDGVVDVDGQPYRAFSLGNAVVHVADGIATQVAPTLATTDVFVDEDAAIDTVVATIVGSDPDGDAPTVVVDTTGTPFTAVGGDLTVSGALDFEAVPTYVLPVTLTDAQGLVTEDALTVALVDVNEAPRFVSDTLVTTVVEQAPTDTLVVVANAADDDLGDVLSYTFTAGNTDGAFGVDANGRIFVADGTQLDFETEPVRVLTVQATDSGGLSDAAVVTVEIGDLEDISLTFTMPFLTENRSILDPTAQFLTTPPALQQADMGATADGNDAQMWDPVANQPIPFDVQQTDTYDVSFTGSVTTGFLSAYLPVEIDLVIPDSLPVGTFFDIEFDYRLQDDAVAWGETPGMNIEGVFDFADVSGTFSALGALQTSQNWSAQGISLSLDAPGEPFQGAKFSQLFPEGLVVDDVRDLDDAYENQAANVGNYLTNGYEYPSQSLTTEKALGKLFPGADEVLPEDVPNAILVPIVVTDGLNLPLSFSDLLTSLGLPYGDGMSLDVNVPLAADAYMDVSYAIYQSSYRFQTQTSWMMLVELEDVVATITFENGSEFSGSASGPIQVTLPFAEDVDNDGTVDLSIAFEARVRLSRWYGWAAHVGHSSEALKLRYDTYFNVPEVDPLTGETTTTLTRVRRDGFGPKVSRSDIFTMANQQSTDDWILDGFIELPPVTGSVQFVP
jgi:hypothetical protein